MTLLRWRRIIGVAAALGVMGAGRPLTVGGQSLPKKTATAYNIQNCDTDLMLEMIRSVKMMLKPLSRLNPDIAGRLKEVLTKPHVEFRCRAEYADERACAWTHHAGGLNRDKIVIVIPMPEDSSRCSVYSLTSTLFHEMIHGADPDNRYMASFEQHQYGFPDVVNSCVYATFPRLIEEMRKYDREFIKEAEEDSGILIPELDTDCPMDTEKDCKAFRKYASVCKSGKNLGPNMAAPELVNCIEDNIWFSCYDPPCEQYRDASNKSGTLLSLTKLIIALDYEEPAGLRERDLALYEAVEKHDFYERCLEDPSYRAHLDQDNSSGLPSDCAGYVTSGNCHYQYSDPADSQDSQDKSPEHIPEPVNDDVLRTR